MIRETNKNQLELPGLDEEFDIKLDPENRWVKLSKQIPWESLSEAYNQAMSKKKGRPAKPARLVIGAVIIKHKLKLSDEETISMIQEGPYLQYFVGFRRFTSKPAFAPSLFVEIRRRMGKKVFDAFNQSILEAMEKPKKAKEAPSEDDDDNSPSQQRKGKLLLDATVSEQTIRYPTDLSLLNEAREISEKLIDALYTTSQKIKPRTYRQIARKSFLSIAKQKKPSLRKRRAGVKQQLQYLKRNLKSLSVLLDEVGYSSLTDREIKQYWVIQTLYEQQREMYDKHENRCDNRIVSIHQPHVRPIVRGKWDKKTEFGAKYGVSLSHDGLASVDHLSWEAYHESADLILQVEGYKEINGYYPEVVLADTIYGTRANRQYLKNIGVRFSGKPLGRPRASSANNEERKRRRQEYLQRIPIEGKFGQGKNGYGLNKIRATTRSTSEAWIRSIFFVMNLMVLAKILFFAPGKLIGNTVISCVYSIQKRIVWLSRLVVARKKTGCGQFFVFE